MNIVAPYRVEEKPHTYSKIDRVERAGYVSNDKKIDEFVRSGLSLVQMRRGQGEYDIDESESDFEEDSEEYLEELTKQAEDFNESPLLQHLDKLTAEEVLAEADLALKGRENQKKGGKRVSSEDNTKQIVNAIKDGFSSLKNSAVSADIPKE